MVDGSGISHLTGWDRDDYSILRLNPMSSVLQMANPDVTDESLESLHGDEKLQELDLNGTQVTDAGLKILQRSSCSGKATARQDKDHRQGLS